MEKATATRYYYLEVQEESQNQRREYRLNAAYVEKPEAPPSENRKNVREIILTDAEVEAFRDLIRTAVLSTGRDDMVTQIISEELEPFFAGDRSAEDTAEIIQKRAAIYLAE